MDDVDDQHVCLKCQAKICGLEKYIQHRRLNCTADSTNKVSIKMITDDDIPTQTGVEKENTAKNRRITHPRKAGRPRRFVHTENEPAVIEDIDGLEDGQVIKSGIIPDNNRSIITRSRLKPSLVNGKSVKTIAKTYECAPCHFCGVSAYSLMVHTRSIKHNKMLGESSTPDEEAEFVCNRCGLVFNNEKSLIRHRRTHKKDPYCYECREDYPTARELRLHCKAMHGEMKDDSRTAMCSICGKVMSKTHIKTHMRLHSGEKPFACDICKFRTNQKGDLKIHKKRHLGIKDHKCSLCDFVTVRASTLRNHMLLHTKRERTEQCHICSQLFYSQLLLKSHVYLKHKMTREHCCTFPGCTYKFKFKAELVSHTRKHTNEKPFLCSVCGYAGSTKQALNRHFRQHTGDKPFKCDHPGCPYRGRVSTHLTRHKRLHTGAKPYKCPYCEYRANTQENLRKHIRNTKKHVGLKVYTCKFCDQMQTDEYQELVAHIRQAHSDDYVTFDKVAHQSGLLANKEASLEDSIKAVYPSTSVEYNIPTDTLVQQIGVALASISKSGRNTAMAESSNTDNIGSQELYNNYIICSIVDDGSGDHNGMSDNQLRQIREVVGADVAKVSGRVLLMEGEEIRMIEEQAVVEEKYENRPSGYATETQVLEMTEVQEDLDQQTDAHEQGEAPNIETILRQAGAINGSPKYLYFSK